MYSKVFIALIFSTYLVGVLTLPLSSPWSSSQQREDIAQIEQILASGGSEQTITARHPSPLTLSQRSDQDAEDAQNEQQSQGTQQSQVSEVPSRFNSFIDKLLVKTGLRQRLSDGAVAVITNRINAELNAGDVKVGDVQKRSAVAEAEREPVADAKIRREAEVDLEASTEATGCTVAKPPTAIVKRAEELKAIEGEHRAGSEREDNQAGAGFREHPDANVGKREEHLGQIDAAIERGLTVIQRDVAIQQTGQDFQTAEQKQTAQMSQSAQQQQDMQETQQAAEATVAQIERKLQFNEADLEVASTGTALTKRSIQNGQIAGNTQHGLNGQDAQGTQQGQNSQDPEIASWAGEVEAAQGTMDEMRLTIDATRKDSLN